ncbi:hypothetical protein FKM82_011371 [Ascaphus truei]
MGYGGCETSDLCTGCLNIFALSLPFCFFPCDGFHIKWLSTSLLLFYFYSFQKCNRRLSLPLGYMCYFGFTNVKKRDCPFISNIIKSGIK